MLCLPACARVDSLPSLSLPAACHLPQCNLGTVSGVRSQSQPCPKIDTERAKKEQAQRAQAKPALAGGFRWPWQAKA